MELPTSRLAEWGPLADLDFILAHQVLADKDYAEHFLNRKIGRECIMDNSYHELGVALDQKDLLTAAQRCNADYIIAPDNVHDAEFTIREYRKLKIAVKDEYRIAVVWTGFSQGSSLLVREAFLERVSDADMLCCTFKLKDRLKYYQQSFIARNFKRVHLLGVDTLEELRSWAHMARYLRGMRNPHINWSVDTGKALKWALRGKKLDELLSLRSDEQSTELGAESLASQHILSLRDTDISAGTVLLFLHNVAVLKEACT